MTKNCTQRSHMSRPRNADTSQRTRTLIQENQVSAAGGWLFFEPGENLLVIKRTDTETKQQKWIKYISIKHHRTEWN